MVEKMKEGLQVAFKKNHLSTEMSDFAYSKKQEQKLRNALIFWEFVKRGYFYDQQESYNEFSQEERLAFLKQFVGSNNQYIALIAKIEMLPTKVWRKILWRYNVDFLSLESFLRRIFFKENTFQREAINGNWLAMYEKKEQPEVLTKRFWDRLMMTMYAVMRWFGMEQFVPDFTSFDDDGRYLSKGAWSHNLAHLDFGFALYPNGVKNDERDINPKLRKFLSLKSHLNDFSTNDEDGVYWFIYRFVRNWGFILSRKIKLSPWVCPGFWSTLIGFFCFFLAPVVSLLFTPLLGLWAWIISLPVILWAVVWLCKIIGGSLYFGIKKRSKVASQLLVVFAVPTVIVLVTFLFCVLGVIFTSLWKLLFSLPWFCAIPIFVSLFFMVGLSILKNRQLRKQWDVVDDIAYKPWLGWSVLGLVVSIVGTLIFIFWSSIWIGVQSAFFFVVEYWFFFLLPILMTVIGVGFWKLSNKEYDEQVQRKTDFILFSLGGVCLVATSYFLMKTGIVQDFMFWRMVLAAFLFVTLIVAIFTFSLRKEKIMNKRRKKIIEDFVDGKGISSSFIEKELSFYFSSLDPEDMHSFLYKLWHFSDRIDYYIGKNQKDTFCFLLPYLPTMKLEMLSGDIVEKVRDFSDDCLIRSWGLIFLLQGQSLQKVLPELKEKRKLISKEEQEKRDILYARREKRRKIWNKISSPFVWTWDKLSDIWYWIVDLVSGLQILVDLFHKICPRNEGRKEL